MCELTLYRDCDLGSITISNYFIDEFLADANDCQIKVYLYLVRMFAAHSSTNISDIADKFNHTEKDVCRSLRYWEKKGVMSLNYDTNGGIVGIRLHEPSHTGTSVSVSGMTALDTPAVQPDTSEVRSLTTGGKPNYTLSELKAFKEREDTPQLIFVAEQYLKRTLSPGDIRSIMFYRDELGFNAELIDYLLQFCISLGKKSFAYMDKVAVDWAEKDIDTVKKARDYTCADTLRRNTSSAAPQQAGHSSQRESGRRKQTSTMFHQFKQNDYDFNTLEQKLLRQ